MEENPMIQKLKGQLQQAKGKIKKLTGNELEGTIDEVKGRAEEEIADARLRAKDRRQGILNQGDKDLESKAREAAENAITQAACEAGILEEARVNAIERMKHLFEFAGFSTVKVDIDPGAC